ncbi:hypothetical protein [Pseudocitrobacter corydidari]|uniref:PH domain-containing protein n=1 Tax=Pseudocitrobacter corydidari TaxID=2891570 RepID=A0ABY3S913_9ENTR|nr:hypothetical protein [Pseudocitrobacter corydidari]UGS42115.1 hypothetical protein G163CM_28400 [Pseudocitrobacter corydidari]
MEYLFINKNKKVVGHILVGIITLLWTLVFWSGGSFALTRLPSIAAMDAIKFMVIPSVVFYFFIFKLYISGPDFRVTETHLEFIKKGRVIQSFSFQECKITTTVTTFKVNGISSGKLREINVDDGRCIKKYGIHLGKDDFNKMMSLVNHYSASEN